MTITTTRAILTGIAMSVSLAMAAPASAQMDPAAPTGTRIKQKAEAVDSDLARKIQRKFAQCVYRSRTENAERLLRSSDYLNIDADAFDQSWDELQRSLRMESCLEKASGRFRGLGMTYSLAGLRAMLTEAAYLDNYDRPLVITEGDEEILTTRSFVEAEDINSTKILAGFADCVVYSAPVEADALVRAEPGSEEENAAIQAIIPHLGPCMPNGNEISLSVASVRSIVADGLWARHAYGRVSTEMEAAE